jgi:hypothetical protein
MSFRNPTPEQVARRQHLYAIVLLIGIPILNALLQKYGIPPIVVQPQQIQQPTLAPPNAKTPDLAPFEGGYSCTAEPSFPLALGEKKPIREARKALKEKRKHLFRKIHERRNPSASTAAHQSQNLPAEEAPTVQPKGCSPWYACPVQ